MRAAIHPAVFLSAAIVLCALWLWLEPVQPPFENMTTTRRDPRTPRESIKLDAAILERYAGHYEGRADFVADLSVKDGRLYIASPSIGAPWEMLATSEDTFFLKESPDIDVKFRIDRRGNVTGFDAATPYGPMRMSRER
jgi:hypothetical protein